MPLAVPVDEERGEERFERFGKFLRARQLDVSASARNRERRAWTHPAELADVPRPTENVLDTCMTRLGRVEVVELVLELRDDPVRQAREVLGCEQWLGVSFSSPVDAPREKEGRTVVLIAAAQE